MNTITVPLSNSLDEFIEEQVRLGNAGSKAELVRRAIQRFKEEEFIQSVLKAKQEIRDGKGLKGELDELVKGFE